MRVCVVGYGGIAEFHREALSGIDGVEISAVVGRRVEPTAAFAELCGAELAMVDLAEALDRPEIDALLITSPSQVHFEQAKAGLLAGKHVLLEIPMALNLADAEELCELADAQGPTLMICHTHRYRRFIRETKRRIDDGELTPLHFHCEWHFFRRSNVGWTGYERSWTDNLLWHHGGHVVDDAVWLFGGEPERARALLGPTENPLGIPMDLSAQMRFPGGGIATYAMSYNAHVPEARMQITLICEEETLTVDEDRILDQDGGELYLDTIEPAIQEQDEEFVNAVREGREALTSGRALLPSMRTLQRLEASAGEGS
jgi:2-hydroxy-4-carboxymuconate semialdehyde hemiacetal dehydrogenase